MIQYYIAKNGQQLGPYSDDQVRALLQGGSVSPQDLFWYHGQSGWHPLSTWNGAFLSPGSLPPPPPPVVNPGAGSGGLVAAGYVCAGVSVLFCPPLFALSGLVIGIVLATRKVHHGAIIIVLSILGGIVGSVFGILVANGGH